MNKIFKIIIATLGGINMVFSIFIPIAIALIIVSLYPNLGVSSQRILVVAGMLSSLFKALDVAFNLKD